MYHFAGQKRQYNVFLQDNLLGAGPFDQLRLPKKQKNKRAQKIFAGQTLTPLQKYIEVRSPLSCKMDSATTPLRQIKRREEQKVKKEEQ